MTSFAVLISGRGTNLAALARAVSDGRLNARLAFAASDNPGAAGLKIAKKAGIPTHRLDYSGEKRAAEGDLARLCLEEGAEWIVLAGFMRILSPSFVASFRGRIVNIHPSLLPAFPGADGIGDAWRYGVKVTGVTVHLVDEGVDTGPILAQKAVEIRPGDTPDLLRERIQRTERRLYWKTLAELFSSRPPRKEL